MDFQDIEVLSIIRIDFLRLVHVKSFDSTSGSQNGWKAIKSKAWKVIKSKDFS